MECNRGADASTVAFGVGVDLRLACRRALSAAHELERALSGLAERWKVVFGVTADFAICVHLGNAAIGSTGPAFARRFTAAGPAVEAARRARAAAAAKGTRIVVALDVLRRAGIHPALLEQLDAHEMAAATGVRLVAPASLRDLAPMPGA